MPVRFAVTKVSGQGEQLVVDVSQWNGVTGEIVHKDMAEMSALLDQALSFCDMRMQDMNLRMLEAYELEKYFTPAVWQRVVAILDILAGRQSANMVARRWHSEMEETPDLEEQRKLYTERAQQQADHYNVESVLDGKDY